MQVWESNNPEMIAPQRSSDLTDTLILVAA